IRNEEFHANRVFDPTAVEHMRASLQPMAVPWLHLAAEAKQRGLRVVTADCAEAEGIDPRHLRLVAYDWTPQAEALLALGARPSVLLSLEPPVIAWWLYAHLGEVSQKFGDVYWFEGARARVAPATRFHPLYFPLRCPPPAPPAIAWDERRFLAMV